MVYIDPKETRALTRGVASYTVVEAFALPEDGSEVEQPDFRGTVLHELVAGEVPVFKLGKNSVSPGPLAYHNVRRVMLFDVDGKYTQTVLRLPNSLVALDTTIALLRDGGMTKRAKGGLKAKVLDDMRGLLDGPVTHPQSDGPGLIGFALPDDRGLEETEFGVTEEGMADMLHKAFRDLDTYRLYFDRLVERVPEKHRAIYAKVVAGEEDDPKAIRKAMKVLAGAADGMAVFLKRDPAISPTSHAAKTLRVYRKAPATAIFLPVHIMDKEFQGDFDGDTLNQHMAQGMRSELREKYERKHAAPRTWRSNFETASKSRIDLRTIGVAEPKDPMVVMSGLRVRADVIGILTDQFGLLTYVAAINHRILGYETRTGVFLAVMGIGVTFSEEVFDAKKAGDEGKELDAAQAVGYTFTDMLMGKIPIAKALAQVPVNETGDSALTNEQFDLLSRILGLMDNGQGRCSVYDTERGAYVGPVLASLGSGWGPKALPDLLRQIPGGQDLYNEVIYNLMVKGIRFHDDEGSRRSVYPILTVPEVTE